MINIISSDEEDEDVVIVKEVCRRGRRNIRKIKEFTDLSSSSKVAYLDEVERLKRLEIRDQERKTIAHAENENKLILDYDFVLMKPLIVVHEAFCSKLKEHQKLGIKFMWDSCFESSSRSRSFPGYGCILAHCMGLGKTFQVVAFSHALLTHPELNISKILILCPKNTVLNWVKEFRKWITPSVQSIHVFNLTGFTNQADRLSELNSWRKFGGVCIVNYDLLRTIIPDTSSQRKKDFFQAIINPGADILFCDEGHIIKNSDTRVAKIVSQIATPRRVVLTGTPLQNNLLEYYTLLQFVRPFLLGTKSEFCNRFVHPILNGQYEDSLPRDVELMKKRSHVLHKTLRGCVQRFDLTTLAAYLPKKYEFVLNLRLTTSQVEMYKNYLEKLIPYKENFAALSKGLFRDYYQLLRISSHPYCLKLYDETPLGTANIGYISESDDEKTTAPVVFPGWWEIFANATTLEDYRSGVKVCILFEIIQHCTAKGEKLLVFSGSLSSIRMIEHFLKNLEESCEGLNSWERDEDYVVLTGDTSGPFRDEICEKFNDLNNLRCRLFLISTKAGGLGINLTAANRCVIYDASWNPSNDIQSIFRIYRLGQDKTCYIYRFIASGTMEEKIYERQVTKQSTSYRVVDEKQTARHYSQDELKELYNFDPDKAYSHSSINTEDPLLTKLLEKYASWIGGIHEHDSLLEHKLDEELEEIEKQQAWSSFDWSSCGFVDEIVKISTITPGTFSLSNFKEALRMKFPQATESVISDMVSELKPRIDDILSRPNLKELLLTAAMENKRKVLATESELISPKVRRRRKGLPVPIKSWGNVGGMSYGDVSD